MPDITESLQKRACNAWASGALKPELPQPYWKLGRLRQQPGKADAAEAGYAQAPELRAEPDRFQQLLDAARSASAEQALPGQVPVLQRR